MKLSEAIRLGSMLRPKGVGAFFHEGKTCAFGAALQACGIPEPAWIDGYSEIKRLWPHTEDIIETPSALRHLPIFGEVHPVWGIVQGLNDVTDWTREQIADFVEAIEPHDEPKLEQTATQSTVHAA